MNTDSFLLKFDGIGIFDEVWKGPLAKFMLVTFYISNFNINHGSYYVANKDKLGLFKSETGSIKIKYSICLQPKFYTVLLNNDSCRSTAKGVDRRCCKNIKHAVYNEIHTSIMN